MVRVIPPEPGERRVPLHVWTRALPKGALAQLERIAAQPYVVEHVAAMPDLHVAHGVAVGTVFATERTLVPAALGGDLGCGMAAVHFDFPAASLSLDVLRRLLARLGQRIPVGDAVHRGEGVPLPAELREAPLSTRALSRERARLGPRHLGTLGGGNHFLELDRDAGGDLWLLVHSGSRGLGAVIAAHHLRVAQAQGQGELPGTAVDSAAGRALLGDLEWALRFARANRNALLAAACEVLSEALGVEPDPDPHIDLHHNFITQEEHFGRGLWIHRKGAIAAPKGARALIPGSMGTASYLVEGLGAPDAFRSGSHGAGRVLTRREARTRISPHRLTEAMRRVVFDPRRVRSLVEEAPSAYRDLREVLEDEADLVRPLLRLEPLAVLKG